MPICRRAAASFPFTVAPGFTGFEHAGATSRKFNRALAAKVLVHRATFVACATCWTQADHGAQCVVPDRGRSAGHASPSACTTRTRPRPASRPTRFPRTPRITRYWVHPSIITGAQLRADGTPDLRLTTKTVLGAAPRSLNDLTGTYKPAMYNNPSNLAVAELNSDIPWIKNEELLLLRAEARWNTGDKAGALADIDLVRVNSGGLAPTTLTAGSSDDDFVTELLYNRLYSLMWEQGTRWIDARRYGRLAASAGRPARSPNGRHEVHRTCWCRPVNVTPGGLGVPCTPLGN